MRHMGRKMKHLRDELIRTFLLYALIPLFVILAVSSALAVGYWNSNVVERNQRCLETAARSVETLLNGSQARVLALAEECQSERLRYDGEYKVELFKKLYETKNSLATASDFYVLDDERRMLLSSRKMDEKYFFAAQSVSWGLVKRLQQQPQRAAYEFIAPIDNFSQNMDVIVGKAVVEKGRITGYVLLVISGNRILSDIANPYVDIIVKDRFDYAPICTNTIFCDELHKLKELYRSANGYVNLETAQFYVAQQPILDGELTLYSFTALSGLIDKVKFGVLVLVTALCCLCAMVVFGVKKQAAAKTKMLDRLTDGFAAVKNGHFDHRVSIDTDNELKLIGDSYNHMLDSLQKLMKNNEERARETVISEIKQLESQFNPHFLFNTLENIRYMIKLNPDAAGRMILALSRLLRYSIDNTAGDVTLKEDLQYLNSYLDIQKLRFGSKLNYAIEADRALYDCVVPKLFLQPIVENAVKYGFQAQENLLIDITLRLADGKMYVRVCDNGCGVSEAELAALNKNLYGTHNDTNHSGLYNVNRRIKLMYGDSYGLELAQHEPSGIVVHMVLPYRTNGVEVC